MIRSALIALGLSVSGVGATTAVGQGLVPAAPVLETCGGTRLSLDAVLLDETQSDTQGWDKAGDVINARIGGLYGRVFDYTEVGTNQVTVSLPASLNAQITAIEPLLENAGLGLFAVDRFALGADDIALSAGQFTLSTQNIPDQVAVLRMPALLTGAQIAQAAPIFDQHNRPAISFRFTRDGADTFGKFTSDNIGNSIAIVLRDEVVSTPRIMSPILGGNGMISGNFTQDETKSLAAVLNSGALPFELTIVAQETLNGSDPSADFCP